MFAAGLGMLSRPLVWILVATSAACAASNTESSSSESGITVTPTGSDTPGQLMITVPAGVPYFGYYTGTSTQSFRLDSDGPFLVPNMPVPVTTGVHVVFDVHSQVEPSGVQSLVQAGRANVTVEDHALTTLRLGGVSFIRGGADPVLGVDGPGVIGADEPVGTLRQGAVIETMTTITAKTWGAWHYDFGLFDGADATVLPGVLTALDVNGRANRKQLRILAPATRALPDAACSGLRIAASRPGPNGGVRQLHGAMPGNAPVVLPAGSALVIGEYSIGDIAPATYETTPIPLSIVLGPVGGEPATLQLERIDVTDVAVRQGDGTTATVHGRYALDQITTVAGADVVKRICDAETATGVDVGPGRYRLVVSYDTVESGTKQDIHDITIP